MPEPRLLLVAGAWPTRDMPNAAPFVVERANGMWAPLVVKPAAFTGRRGWMPLRYTRLAWDAVTTRGRVDGVEAHFLFPTGLIGLVAAGLRRKPLVVYAHGSDVRETSQQNVLYRVLARLVARRAAAIVTNSEDTARHVAQLGARAEVIPPGVDVNRFHPTPRPTVRRVLYLGGNPPHKGLEVAMELADAIRGPGIDPVRPDEMPAVLAAHDVVLVPSHEEPFGLVALEAIACGRWVVARAVGGLRDIVIDGVNGTLVSDGDFAGAIAAVPDYDPDVVAATARRFTWEEHNRRMAELWARVLAHSTRVAADRRRES